MYLHLILDLNSDLVSNPTVLDSTVLIGGVLGAVLFLLIIVIVVVVMGICCYVRRPSQKKKSSHDL